MPASASSSVTVPEAASAARARRNAAHFSAGSITMRGARPSRRRRRAPLRQGGARRQHQFHGSDAVAHPRQGLAEDRQQPADLAGAAARQHQNERRRFAGDGLFRPGTQLRQPFGQRMADINAGRTAEPPMCRRLERQDREYAIYIIAHGPGPPRPPRPYRGRNVVDDRDRRHPGAHAAGDPVGEIGAVDDHDGVGTGRDDRIRRFPDAPQNHRQAPAE